VGLSIALIWPNLGERTIRVHASEALSPEKREEALQRAEKYVGAELCCQIHYGA
jgi:hypothetical protein